MKTSNLLIVACAFLVLSSYAAEASTPELGRSILRPAALLEPPALEPTAASPQGPLGGPQIAVIESVQGDVRVARAALRTNVTRVSATDSGVRGGLTRVSMPGLGLANGDVVQTLQGKADIRFTNQSIITPDVGTSVTITERPAAGRR